MIDVMITITGKEDGKVVKALHVLKFATKAEFDQWILTAPAVENVQVGPDIYIDVPKTH